MLRLKVNGQDSQIGGGSALKIADLVELLKASIDPEHMITAIRIDGRELEDQDWYNNTSAYGTAILEVETDKPENFLNDRFAKAFLIVGSCFLEFRDARKGFQTGDMMLGNKRLVQAVHTTKSFFEWYSSLLELVPNDQRPNYDISKQVEEISQVCKRICQQQLYQSWWALGETIEKELEPKLDKLEDHCRRFAAAA